MKFYIIEGPQEMGSQFGYSGEFLPEGKFAVVFDGGYTDGGYGPISANGIRNASREGAEKRLAELTD
jgi:hypothetical protein